MRHHCTTLRHHLYNFATSLVQLCDITCTTLRHHLYNFAASLVQLWNITCTSLQHHLYNFATSLVQLCDITCTTLRHHLYNFATRHSNFDFTQKYEKKKMYPITHIIVLHFWSYQIIFKKRTYDWKH